MRFLVFFAITRRWLPSTHFSPTLHCLQVREDDEEKFGNSNERRENKILENKFPSFRLRLGRLSTTRCRRKGGRKEISICLSIMVECKIVSLSGRGSTMNVFEKKSSTGSSPLFFALDWNGTRKEGENFFFVFLLFFFFSAPLSFQCPSSKIKRREKTRSFSRLFLFLLLHIFKHQADLSGREEDEGQQEKKPSQLVRPQRLIVETNYSLSWLLYLAQPAHSSVCMSVCPPVFLSVCTYYISKVRSHRPFLAQNSSLKLYFAK